MGLITSQIRLLYLQQQRLDLEYKIQLITQTKMGLSQSVSVLEQKLDMQMLQYQSRLKMIDAEYQSCLGMIDKNIQSSFTYR